MHHRLYGGLFELEETLTSIGPINALECVADAAHICDFSEM